MHLKNRLVLSLIIVLIITIAGCGGMVVADMGDLSGDELDGGGEDEGGATRSRM